MRKAFFSLVLFLSAIISNAQDRNRIDSLKQALSIQTEDTLKIKTFESLCWLYNFYNPDTARFYAEECLQLAKKIHSKKGEDVGYLFLWASEFVKGNYYKAMEIITEQLKICEEANDMARVAGWYNALFNCYRDMGNYQECLQSELRAIHIWDSLGHLNYVQYTNLGNAYEKLNQLDSALYYANKVYETEYVKNKGTWTWPAYVLGVIHAKLHNYDLALAYYHQADKLAIHNNNFKDRLDNYNGMAEVFKEKDQIDSVIFYSREALQYYNTVYYPKGAMEATANLAWAYKSKRNTDSTLKYFEFSAALKDSLYSQQKTMQVQNLAFTEQKRQQEADERRVKEKEEQRRNLQYALIGIGLLTFLILFFLLSHSVIVRTGFIKFLGVVALLLVFEFINLFLHPYLTKITNDSPVIMLLILAGIAALLVPLHHRLEKWVTHRLTEKNKRIRLEAAKKTIARLERE